MYLYSLHGYEGGYILINDKKYNQEVFEKMCKEAPLGGVKFDNPFYSDRLIKKYLIDNYGFKEADFIASFFTDADVE